MYIMKKLKTKAKIRKNSLNMKIILYTIHLKKTHRILCKIKKSIKSLIKNILLNKKRPHKKHLNKSDFPKHSSKKTI